MSYVFFPGCSLEGTARDFAASTQLVARKLGLDLPHLKDWICCGSTSAHQCDALLSLALPARNLAAANGKTVVAACAACYSRLKAANHAIAADAATRRQVAQVTQVDYDGRTPVLHLLEVLVRQVGLDAVAERIQRPLTGLKVACYYGCLLSRPPEVTAFDNPENPTLMDELLAAAGAQTIDWPHKTECCGASYSITDVSIVRELTGNVLAMARLAGADCIATACPLCQINLDLRQKESDAACGSASAEPLPVFFFTQLLGLALGAAGSEVGLKSMVVDPLALLSAKGIAV